MEAPDSCHRASHVIPKSFVAFLLIGFLVVGGTVHLDARRELAKIDAVRNVELLRLDFDPNNPDRLEGVLEGAHPLADGLVLDLRITPPFESVAEARSMLEGWTFLLHSTSEFMGRFDLDLEIKGADLIPNQENLKWHARTGNLWTTNLDLGRHRISFKAVRPASLVGGWTVSLHGHYWISSILGIGAGLGMLVAISCYVIAGLIGLSLLLVAILRHRRAPSLAPVEPEGH